MASFTYVAATKEGKRVSGEREADSRDTIAQFLHDQQLVVLSIDEKLGVNLKSMLNIQIGGVPLAEKVVFAKQLSTMLTAGLPIIQALEILVQQTENENLKAKLNRVYKSVESGASLSDSFKKEKAMFDDLQLSLIVAGEKSGTLNEVMIKIAEDLEKSKSLHGKIIGAMIYPVIIFFVMIIVFVLMLVFMVPSVRDLYADFGESELPGITQFMVDLSNFFTNPFGVILILIFVVTTVVLLRYAYTTKKGRRRIDRIFLRLPVFGALNTKVQLERFNHLLSLLLKSGVPIVEALRVVANSMGNSLYKDLVEEAAAEVLKGNSMSIPLAKSDVFPLIMLKMIATGEQTGKLDQITADMAAYYEAEVEEITSNLTKLMEPFILLTVGALVGFMAVAIYLPLYSIGEKI